MPAVSRCKLYRQGAEYGYFPASIKPYLRLPSGHPEGFHEALANLHRTLEWTIRGGRGESVPKPFEHPGIADGVAGMAFIEAAVASSQAGRRMGRGPQGRMMIEGPAARPPFPERCPRERPSGPVQRGDRRRTAPEVRPVSRAAPLSQPQRGRPRPDARGLDRRDDRSTTTARRWGSSP